jgi:peptide methionine sulfoxide reductase MsrB
MEQEFFVFGIKRSKITYLKEKTMKKLFGTGIIATLVVVLASGWAYAGKLLFPYINSNPGNLSTIISVINTASDEPWFCDDETVGLHLQYMTKSITAKHTDICVEHDFCRPTTENDIVSFDVAGNIAGGEAMFNDDTDYDSGFGAPNFDLPGTMGVSSAQRGYLLVTHTCGTSCEYDEACMGDMYIDGEAMLLDIVNGAAWGYRAAKSNIDDDDNGETCHSFARFFDNGECNPGEEATTELMNENRWCQYDDMRNMQPVALYPPDEFTTRFFVTPLVMAVNATGGECIGNTDMSVTTSKWQKRTRIALKKLQWGEEEAGFGGFNRNEGAFSVGKSVTVTCVGAVNLGELVGDVIDAPGFRSEGGWAYLDLMDPKVDDVCKDADHAAIVTKLQFGTPAFAKGSMINSADTIRGMRVYNGWD